MFHLLGRPLGLPAGVIMIYMWFSSVSEALFSHTNYFSFQILVKSVQSALSDLLTTSATHGTFSRPSTKRGLILIGLELNTNARESFEHC